jgi:hypothetical protein
MIYNITSTDEVRSKEIYNILVNQQTEYGILNDIKQCIDEHTMVPDLFTFSLTEEEAKEVRKMEGVLNVSLNRVTEIVPDSLKTESIKKVPCIASNNNLYGPGFKKADSCPLHIHYCQTYNPSFIHEDPINAKLGLNFTFNDCSNVDIIIIDEGIDALHPEFFNENGVTRVANFDWSQLKESGGSTGTSILPGPIPEISGYSSWVNYFLDYNSDYYIDTTGHGTSCASVAAGNICGFAKGAKIYNLNKNKIASYANVNFFKILLSFVKSKKLNLYGLSSSRPTVVSMSLRSGASSFNPIYTNDVDTNSLCKAIDKGLPYIQPYIDDKEKFIDADVGAFSRQVVTWSFDDTTNSAYIRQILNENAHMLFSAGNENIYLVNGEYKPIFLRYAVSLDEENFNIINNKNTSFYNVDTYYDSPLYYNNYMREDYRFKIYTGLISAINFGYRSLNVGYNFLGYSKVDYPLIHVGCVTPIGQHQNPGYSSNVNMVNYFNILTAATPGQIENKIILNKPGLRYTSHKDQLFVKTTYSNFGPDVDVYAPGDSCWSARSSHLEEINEEDPFSTFTPYFSAAEGGYYVFFNGTSCATPVAAGCLATYLADVPNATNKQAKNWLLSAAVSGNIIETVKTTVTINTSGFDDFIKGDGSFTNHQVIIPYGGNVTNTRYSPFVNIVNENGNIEDFIQCGRFFDSNNLVVQAFPLRKAILNRDVSSVTVAQTTLLKSGGTIKRPSHK